MIPFRKLREFFSGKKDKKSKDKDKPEGEDPNLPGAPTDGRDTSLADMAAKGQKNKSLFDTNDSEGEYDEDGYLKVSIPLEPLAQLWGEPPAHDL